MSLWYELANYDRAFPEQSIKFDITREESKNKAIEFLQKRGHDISDYHHAVSFDYDHNVQIFIEKEVGFEQSGKLLSQDLQIWRWSNRWFRSLTKEEFILNVTPSGKITQYKHVIPENAEAPGLAINEARKLVYDFIKKDMEVNLSNWEFLEDQTMIRPNRIDYTFTFQKKNFEIYGANSRFVVGVQGNEIGSYSKYLKIPENWTRDYQHMRSLNSTVAIVAYFFSILILIAALVIFISYLSRRDIRLKTALIIGIFAFSIQMISILNQLPLHLYYFDTNQTFANFYTIIILQGFLKSLVTGLMVFIVFGAGEALYRQHYPKRQSISKTFTLKGLQTKNSFFSMLTGIALAVFFLAFQSFFYLTAKKFGAWSPSEIPYSKIFNTCFPWIFVILTGFIPAITEESVYRLFSIPFFQKFSKSRTIAILIPAIIWGFAHSNYPNQPFWIRGVEVGMFGIMMSAIFLKFGVLTTIVWHYTFNALNVSIILMKSGNRYFIISGIIAAGIMLLPLIYSLVCYLKRKGFVDSVMMTNQKEGSLSPIKSIKPIEKLRRHNITPLNSSRRKTGIVLGFIFIILLLFIKPAKIGEFYSFPIQKEEVLKRANIFLRERGVDPGRFRQSIDIQKNYNTGWGKYILENGSIDQLNAILAREISNSAAWDVRFFKEQEKEEYHIYIHPCDKNVVAFDHLLDEEAPGYTLNKDIAKRRIEVFLDQHSLDLSNFKLVEDFSTIKKNRTDHSFIYESIADHPANVAEGRLRLKVAIKGDEIASFSRYYKIPESWERNYEKQTSFDSLRLALQIIALIIIAIIALFYLKNNLKNQNIPWRPLLLYSGIISLLYLLSDLTALNSAMKGYDTSLSINIWLIIRFISALGQTIVIGGIIFSIIVSARILLNDTELLSGEIHRDNNLKDSLLVSVVFILGLFTIAQFSAWADAKWSANIIDTDFIIPHFALTKIPAIHVISRISLYGSIACSAIGIIVYFLKNLFPNNFYRITFLFVLVLIFQGSNVDTLPELFVSVCPSILIMALIWICIKYFFMNNLNSYLIAGFGYFTVRYIIEMISSGTPQARVTAYLFILILLGFIVWILTGKNNSPEQSSVS